MAMIAGNVKYLVVHCSATAPTENVGARDIDRWHRLKGWARIGYHYVIRRNGNVEKGREDDKPGAHVQGHNHESIGICMVGGIDAKGNPENNFTPEQFTALGNLLDTLQPEFPAATILGHRDLSPDKDGDGVVERDEWLKACPSFDVRVWWADRINRNGSPVHPH